VGAFHLDGAVLYASCEPCAMCLAAAYWSHIARICCACSRADAERIGFADREIYDQLALPPAARRVPMVSLLEDEGRELLREWCGRPDRVPY
jgi:tRNA(Arg) A34 adenosine deaminase TadA